MENQKVLVKVPASTANLGPGFDSIGMAFDLFAWIEMKVADRAKISLFGDQLNGVSTDKSNLVYQMAELVFEKAGVSCPPLEISMYSEIPLTRGLGSSASAIVGALVAANELSGKHLAQDDLFQLASSIEKHPDNVGASLFGGLVVGFWDGEQAKHIRIEPSERLEVLVAIPEFQLSTKKARNALPEQIPLLDAVFNVGHSSLLVAALCTGELEMIPFAMKDVLHQPYRSSFIPGMSKILEEATNYGALGAALSGAGPTILTLVDSQSKTKPVLEAFLKTTFAEENIPVELLWLKPNKMGVEVLTQEDEHSTFIKIIKGEVRA